MTLNSKSVLTSLVFLLLLSTSLRVRAGDFCTDQMLLDGSESLVSFGMDSTKNWWAVSSPYEKMYRLWVNGKKTGTYNTFNELHFSPDGEHWAVWTQFNNVWSLLSDNNPVAIQCTAPGEIAYVAGTQSIMYTYFDGNQEIVVTKNRRLSLVGRASKLYSSFLGDKLAFVLGQLGTKTLVIDGKQVATYDDILPIGFWTDGQFVFAAQSGNQWRIYRGDEEIAGPYADVKEFVINLTGTVAAAIVTQGNLKQVVLFSDEYTRPVVSRLYQELDALVLHPTLALWGARSQLVGSALVIMTGTEYSAGSFGTGRPTFTADGKELIYYGCDTDCFISINGKKIPLSLNISIDATFAHKSSASTFAYSSASSLIFREIERPDLWVSKMCDETSLPRFNWRANKYEALGRINQRLYLLSCMK